MTMRGGESASIDHKKVMRSSRSSPSKSMINIDDLSDVLLVEILCRLPCKSIVQCKCVSKHWFSIISDPGFVSRFLCPTFFLYARSMSHLTKNKGELFTMSSEPHSGPFLTVGRRFSLLSFLPLDEEPEVVVTYNDLVLCCTTRLHQRDYYICNPYTKQWLALPPPPKYHKFVMVGFICDEPYHNKYMRCKVVRIPKKGDKSLHFEMEIFSLETGEWREFVVSSQGLPFNFERGREVGVAYNGMLYWSDYGGRLFGLDPSINNSVGDHIIDHKYHCCFIDKPVDGSARGGMVKLFGVFQGCLRVCQYFSFKVEGGSYIRHNTLRVWELREEEVDGGELKLKWCLIQSLCLDQLASENPFVGEWVKARHWTFGVLGFDFEDNHLYLGIDGDIVMWNIPTNTSIKIYQRKRPDCDVYHQHWIQVFPFVLPWCPTPLPSVLPFFSGQGPSVLT